MRFPGFGKVSLAAKVRLLFGAALALILAVALFAPWDRMKRLVEEQDLTRAREAAAFRLYLTCSGGEASDEQVRQRLRLRESLQVGRAPEGPTRAELLAPPPKPETAEKFLRRGLEYFAKNADRDEVYRYHDAEVPQTDAAGREVGRTTVREFDYVRALRITANCAACHTRGAAPPLEANQLAGLIRVRMPATASQAQTFWNRFSLIGAAVVAAALAVVVFYVIMKSLVLSPVRKLRRLADRIGEGELSIRSTIRTGDEFERLAKAFNSMLERLEKGQAQMRQINESLNSKMDELARANIALFESNKLKGEFLASVSHELRTPLNSIIGFAEVLREQMAEQLSARPDDAPAGKAARYADNILTSGRMLLELINDLLDLAKIEAGKMAVRREKVVVGELVEAVVNFMRPSAEKKSLHVEVRIEPDLPLVTTDAGKFQQILYNLFSNAVKFTPPRGYVTVRAWRPGPDELRLSVIDTGPGIPPEDQPGLFEKFHQLDRSATREHGGTGLGLAISRELAHMLGGDIALASKVGEGSTFTLSLPLAGPPEADGGESNEAERGRPGAKEKR